MQTTFNPLDYLLGLLNVLVISYLLKKIILCFPLTRSKPFQILAKPIWSKSKDSLSLNMDLDLSASPEKYKTSGPVPKSTACSRRKRLRKIKMATNNTHSVITFVQYLFLCKMLIVFLFIPFQNIGHSYENGQASNHQPLLHDDSPASWDYHMEWNISVETTQHV